ncbi:MAG: phosphoserine transaminase [Gammaproteobacteria bacterium]
MSQNTPQIAIKPSSKPVQPSFSSGPCPKRPGWSPQALGTALVGRSHRSKEGKARLNKAIEDTRVVLGIPDDYLIGIVPGSDTGAVEMALWNLLGPLPVDVLAWESFGSEWVTDVLEVLKLDDAQKLVAPYGQLPDLGQVNFDHDVVFVWNGTTSGVKLPNGDWISDDRKGLTICDATSAAFAMELPWPKLDVVTFSWQKVLGGEGAHGVLIMSPRAVSRLESFDNPRPLPKIFRMLKKGRVDSALFEGATINTPSMLCVEDYLDALKWAQDIGGLEVLCERSQANLDVIKAWVAETPWIDFLAENVDTCSNTSICLRLADAVVSSRGEEIAAQIIKQMVGLLETEKVAYDINAYRSAPSGLRIWGGATVEADDLKALLPWLEWAYSQAVESI